jgi:hypothetical protein
MGDHGAEPHRNLLEDLAVAIHAAVPVADGEVQAEAKQKQAPVRPAPFADPWSRGGGFLGSF